MGCAFFQNGIQPETLLIQHALQGFDACKQLVQSDETCIGFESKEFDKHKVFTSDPDRAFYIKDVCLEVYGKMASGKSQWCFQTVKILPKMSQTNN